MMLKHIIDPEVEEYEDVYDDDEKAAQEGYLRVVDESQEDYLYPEFYFIFVKLPRKAQETVVATG